MFSVKAIFKLVQYTVYTVDVFAVFIIMKENFIHISKLVKDKLVTK